MKVSGKDRSTDKRRFFYALKALKIKMSLTNAYIRIFINIYKNSQPKSPPLFRNVEN